MQMKFYATSLALLLLCSCVIPRGSAGGASSRPITISRARLEKISGALKKCKRARESCANRIAEAEARVRIDYGEALAKIRVDLEKCEGRVCPPQKCERSVLIPVVVAVGGVLVGVGVGIVVGALMD